jgi:hypothetical protein
MFDYIIWTYYNLKQNILLGLLFPPEAGLGRGEIASLE